MPIDIASGTAKLDFDDLVLPGQVPLVWDRHYSTALLADGAAPTALGLGWTNRWLATLSYDQGQFTFFTPEGGREVFDNPDQAFAKGQVLRLPGAFLELYRQGRRAVVRSWDVEGGDIRCYVFDGGAPGSAWPLAALEDVTGLQGVDLARDGDGRLVGLTQRLERRGLALAYGRQGRIESVDMLAADGSRHPVARYAYDAAGRLAEARDAADFADRFDYDDAGRIVREVAKDGGVFHYRYDERGRCVRRSGLDHYNERRLKFLDAIRVTEVTNSCGETTVFQHLPSGQAVGETDPLGHRKTTAYDDHGRIVALTDATGATTRYTYDAKGNRDSIVDALGRITLFTFNDHHQPVAMVDAAGRTWRRAYDAQQRLVATMDPLDAQWRFSYDAEGNVAEVVNPKGDRRQQRFARGVLQSATDWMGHATHYRFDAFGRVTERRGPLGEATQFRYDVIGNPVQVRLPDGNQLAASYDHAGNLTRLIDANGHATRWRYGPCSRLLARTDPVGGTVHYLWGSEPGRLDALVNEKGEHYRFERDGAGRIVREVSFDGAVRSFALDGEGHSLAYTNANSETIAIRRDALHRVIDQQLPDGEQIEYGFDPLGRLIKAVNADAAVAIERDALGRITRETQGSDWVASGYDSVGNLVTTRTSLGHEARYEHDANGRQTAIVTAGGKRIAFERDANGQETARQMPGGTRLTQRFDIMGRLVEQRVAGSGGHASHPADGLGPAGDLVRRDYHYDRNGALTRIVDGRWGQVDYAYDPAERLLSALWQRGATGAQQLGGPSEQFAYDPAGNLTRMRAQAGFGTPGPTAASDDTLEYGPGNRLLRKGTTRFEYDAEGRRIRKIENADGPAPKVWVYEWNALDRLKKVTRPDGEAWAYRYDALARRFSKQLLSQADDGGSRRQPKAERFIWDKDVVAHHRLEGSDDSTWLFEPTSFAPLAKVVAGHVQALINDHLGTPRELLSESGTVLARAAAGAWEGGAWSHDCPVGFQGQWSDDESGLRYNLSRYYDSRLGSFISADPIGLSAGENHYFYCKSPINWIDPFGLVCVDDNNNGNGYVVYHITDKKGKVVYVGITQADRFRSRQQEHSDSGRLSGGRKMKVAVEVETYGQARGTEQAHIEHYKTLDTSSRGTDLKKNPGNRQSSYDTTRTDDRATAFNAARNDALAGFAS